MSAVERRALITMLVLGISGHFIRSVGIKPSGQPVPELFDPAGDGDPRAHLAKSISLGSPLGSSELVDVDTAGIRQLRRLPGIGPALARRIVADRESRGAFGGIAALDRVPGIGPATLKRLTGHLSFSGTMADAEGVEESLQLSINRAGIAELQRLPGIGPVKAGAIVAFRDSAGPFRNILELRTVPGISPGLVDRLAPSIRL
jgi:competence ComEA-like helix-hairpin-helix protein